MSFFVKCPKQRPVQGRFKKVQTCPPSGRRVYGALEDNDMVPFGLELRAERLLHHFETAHYCECIGHYKKRHTHAP
jgi:hypothetical protein